MNDARGLTIPATEKQNSSLINSSGTVRNEKYFRKNASINFSSLLLFGSTIGFAVRVSYFYIKLSIELFQKHNNALLPTPDEKSPFLFVPSSILSQKGKKNSQLVDSIKALPFKCSARKNQKMSRKGKNEIFNGIL